MTSSTEAIRLSRIPFAATAITGGWLVISVASMVAWGHAAFWLLRAAWPLVLSCVLAYVVAWTVFHRLVQFPKPDFAGLASLVASGSFAGALVILASARTYYSLRFLVAAAAMTGIVLWLSSRSGLVGERRALVIPGGRAAEVAGALGVRVIARNDSSEPSWVLVDLSAPLDDTSRDLLANAALRGARVVHAGALLESASGRIIDSIGRVRDVYSMKAGYESLKRILEVGLILLTSPLTIPLAALVAVAVYLDSPGPVLFVQERIGRHGKSFRMLKFRSMSIARRQAEPLFADAEEARITRVGRFIRKFRLDELPQFINVLRGEMSLIGPRPEQPGFVRQFEVSIPGYGLRHLVSPGISGWAQVTHGYAASTDETREKLMYDLFYIANYSLWMDLLIVFKTIKTMLNGFGAK